MRSARAPVARPRFVACRLWSDHHSKGLFVVFALRNALCISIITSGEVCPPALLLAGYEVTITAPPLAALCVLTEREQVDVVGFNTVAAALHKTSFWRRLKER